jgi:hypothetical protein
MWKATVALVLAVAVTHQTRIDLIHRAEVWTPTDTAALDITAGPQADNGFLVGDTVTCDYVAKKMEGASPKFTCAVAPGDEVKVKYGRYNGEVYGEVAATRLLWALGFGADRMYPVRVLCRGCPARLVGASKAPDVMSFDVAAIERKLPGKEITEGKIEGWGWNELNLVEEQAGGASPAERDALKLLAVFIQHTDSKSAQQRLTCLDKECAKPLMMVNDLGLTFGRANAFNMNPLSSVNYDRWSTTPIWKGDTGCKGNLPKSTTGTLDNPVIGEAGRAFLADRLLQLSDAQLHDLFEVARFELRSHDPDKDPSGPPATIDQWVKAFEHKRDEVVSRRCSSALSPEP